MSENRNAGGPALLDRYQSKPELFQPTEKAFFKAYITAFGEPYAWGGASSDDRMDMVQAAIDEGKLSDVFVKVNGSNHVVVCASMKNGHGASHVESNDLGPNLSEYIELKPEVM